MSPVFRELLRREFAERSQGSLLGRLWWLLPPLLQFAALAWVFAHVLPARSVVDAPYPVFLAGGLWAWWIFGNALQRGIGAYVENAALIGKVAIPPGNYPDARVAASIVLDVAAGVLLCVTLAMTWRPGLLGGLPLAMPAIALLSIHAWLLARIFALCQVVARDTQPLVGQWLGLAFFLTPILYERRQLPAGVADALALNPLTPLVEHLRHALLGEGVDPIALAYPGATAALLGLLAAWVGRRARQVLGDHL